MVKEFRLLYSRQLIAGKIDSIYAIGKTLPAEVAENGAVMIEHLIWAFSTLLVVATVSVHYEVMTIVSDYVIPWARRHVQNRRIIAFAVAALMLGHIAEIWLFALIIKALLLFPELGGVQGEFTNKWEDFLYLSAVNYTSLGDNALRLVGPVRAITACETLVGVMMIGWSASFTYLKMESLWKRHLGGD